MTSIVYDGTFEGWLTAVFEVYEYKFEQAKIVTEGRYQPDVFAPPHNCVFNKEKADRVWKGLSEKVSKAALTQVYKTFLSEEGDIEDVLLQYVKYAFSHRTNIECDFSHPSVIKVAQTAKMVGREKHRMEAFVRFQLTSDGIYYAVCQPDFNVLPLIKNHFQKRYADQKWLIYDSRRKYGIFYDLNEVNFINLCFNEATNGGKNVELIMDEKESLYQQLWQHYFKSVNINARKNMKLHIQHMPKRYWKHLPEKQVQNF
jgi:probable DNA metabolism protein